MARNNEPAFRRKTPLLICSIRTEIPYPCIGSSANVFRMSISSVPWTRSLGLSGINLIPLGYQEEHYASHTGCQGERRLALPQYFGRSREYSCDHQFRCDCRGPWRNLFAGDGLSFTQKLT